MIVESLLTKKYEHKVSAAVLACYLLERRLCHLLLRRYPPRLPGASLLHLGCGPRYHEGWVNADDYAIRRRIRNPKFKTDWALDIGKPWRCEDSFWDGIFTEHVLEYFTYSESVGVLRDCFRTLKPGAWMRISLPDTRAFADCYYGKPMPEKFPMFPHPVIAISFVAQMHLHVSTWDADMMMQVMRELGFVDVKRASYKAGTDIRLFLDDPSKEYVSFYVEGRKP